MPPQLKKKKISRILSSAPASAVVDGAQKSTERSMELADCRDTSEWILCTYYYLFVFIARTVPLFQIVLLYIEFFTVNGGVASDLYRQSYCLCLSVWLSVRRFI